MLQVSIVKHHPGFTLEAAFTAPVPGVTALFGRSGSGKTTLVNIISGLLRPDEGTVRLGDEVLTDTRAQIAVPAERRGIGYVFQDARLFPHLSVAANLTYGARRSRASGFISFDEAVSLLGLGNLLGRKPRELSGGEAQRVSLGRAPCRSRACCFWMSPWLPRCRTARRSAALPRSAARPALDSDGVREPPVR